MAVSMPKPLDGITVLDLTRVLAGPYCAQLLGDFGADVIKIEQPGRGDDTRQWQPPAIGGESAYYIAANRNKRSLTLNLRHPAGADVLRKLVPQADVLVENFKFGGMGGMGLGYESLREINPRLVYCSIEGYGKGSPYERRPGYDFMIQAQSGFMSITGEPDGEPQKAGIAIVDVTTGLYACTAVLAALRERDASGQGQFVEVSLMDSALSLLVNQASSYLVAGTEPKRYGNAHAVVVPYQTFQAQDRRFALAVGNDLQFRAMCRLIGAPELADDARFATNPARIANRPALLEALEPVFASQEAGHWLGLFNDAGIPAGPINTIPQMLEDPHVAAREMVVGLPHPTAGTLRLLAPPFKLSRTPATVDRPPPLMGQHTDEVLSERLGLSAEEIDQLREDGAI
jgi:formyl-CoA transferase